ncbi:hypothetical protein G9A89_021753 [Geosiphon pyriformis]|nr:hypothetical protein G9A89_021753 [Geosiphon pyriformis]
MENKEIKRTIRPYAHDCNECESYEWIPWEGLSNINEIGRGGFGIIYKATLIDGLIDNLRIKHHGEMEYKIERTDEFGKKIDKVAIKVIKTNSSEVFKEYGFVMEFAEHGDMRKYLTSYFHSTSWLEKLFNAYSIASGLDSIHSSCMVHRDLHSGNILQLSQQQIQIGDLGLSQPVNNEATTTEEKKIYGVIPYIPPEELATGKPPFHGRSHDHLLIMDILNGQRPETTSPLIPPCIAEIIEKCWDTNPENRPTAKEVDNKLEELYSIYILFTGEFKTESPERIQFLESEKYVKEMLKNDSETTTTTTTTTTPTRIHPEAFYTSHVLSLQMIEETKG